MKRCYYKHLIVTIIIVLIYLSGCLDKLSTYEKQDCITATHYAETSIPICSSQKNCYKKLETLSFNSSNKLPTNISNKLEFYKNNISSSIFYFNNSKELLNKINKNCKNNKFDIELIDNINDLFFNISQVFSYLDKGNENTINILKDYAIYFKNQDIYEISEEELYSDFIEINNNINELQKEDIENNSYVSYMKQDSKEINIFAKQLGFKKTYLSKVNYIDLYSYYFDLTTDPQERLLVPKSGLSSTYIISFVSKLESISKANKKLKTLNSYDLYLLYDRMFGFNNSTLIKFKILNNKIILDYDIILDKIIELENYGRDNYNYIDDSKKSVFIKNKYNYLHNNLSFGKYLSTLKTIKNNIEYNKLNLENQQIINNDKIKECEDIVLDYKNTENIYLKSLIEKYTIEDNLLLKIELCNKIKDNLNYEDCTNIISQLVLLDISELENIDFINLEDINSIQCNNILGNINYFLVNNSKIKYLNNICKNNLFLISESKKIEDDSNLRIINLESRVIEIKNLQNYLKIQNIDLLIQESLEVNTEIKEINKNKLENSISENQIIRYINNNYYLELESVFDYKIYDLETTHNFEDITSNDELLNIRNKYFTVSYLNNGLNYFLVNYNNVQNIFEKILLLNLDKSLLEINIENTITGIEDIYYIGSGELIDNTNFIDSNGYLHYTTNKNNKILVLKKILNKEITNLEFIELSENKFIKKEIITIENITNKDIDQILYFKDLDLNEALLIKYNSKDLDYDIINDYITFNITLEPYDLKYYEVLALKDKTTVFEEIQFIINTLNSLKNSIFEDISNEANDINIVFKNLEDYTITEIQEIYILSIDIFELEELELNNINLENLYNLKINVVESYNLNSEELEELDEIDSKKYDNINWSYNQLIDLEERILQRLIIQEDIDVNDIDSLFLDNINLIEDYNITNSTIDNIINKFKNSEDLIEKKKLLEKIDSEINKELKINLDLIYNLIITFDNIDWDEFNLNLEILNLQYENIDLLDLYSVNYYPKINQYDIDRISKKIKDVNTKTFKNKITNFKTQYNNNNLELANNIFNKTNVIKLDDFIVEVELVNDYITELKNYTLQLIKNDDSKLNIDTINLAQEKYENKRYFEAIFLLKKGNSKLNGANNTSNLLQNIIIIIIFGILFLIYLYFNKNKKKINYKERKQKVIRHY